jgi:hypothetical protein
LALPELVVADEASEVSVCFGSVDLPLEEDVEEAYAQASDQETLLFFREVGAFLIREGRHVTISPAPGCDERWLRHVTLGPGLGVLLHQRGRLVLHASAVAVADGAVAFMGERGIGKSTMAAVMCARGHPLVADDVTAIAVDGGHPVAFPAYPQLKLWPEAASFLRLDLKKLPRLFPGYEKRAHPEVNGFSLAPRPLKRIYLLTEDETQEIEPLGFNESLVELVRHSYGRWFIDTVKDSSHFLRCSDVAKNITVSRLKGPRSLTALPELARLVEEDLK